MTASVVLIRYGTIPEVSRFVATETGELSRGERVLVETHRGLQLGTVLSKVRTTASTQSPVSSNGEGTDATSPAERLPPVVRRATPEDQETDRQLHEEARAGFDMWCERITKWELELELIDLEWTADRQKLVLYVINHRGPDCTKLALQAAAAGLGMIEVQPVTADGLVTVPDSSAGGGCGTCGSH